MKKIVCFVLVVILCLTQASCGSSNKSPNSDEAIKIKLMIGRDKQWIFDEAAKIIEQSNLRIHDKKISLVIEKAGTGEAMDKILDPASDYIGWMPASSTHIAWANDTWLKKGNTTPLLDSAVSTVFLSPTVLAMPESLAKLMGYPKKKIGWFDILDLSVAKNGWGLYGMEALNPVRFAHTHPAKSNSGLNALIAAEYAFSNKQKGLTLEDVKGNTEKLKEMQKTIVHYGESTSLLQSKIAEKGSSFIQYAVLYEYMVADLNHSKKSKEKVLAIYPREGTIWGDVSFVKVKRNIKNDEQKQALDAINSILLSPEIQKKGMEAYFFRPANMNIPLSPQLNPELGIDPKEPQTTLELPTLDVINAILRDWSQKTKKRANVVFVMDTSGSMQGDPLIQVKEALKNLLTNDIEASNYNGIDQEDILSLLPFSSAPQKAFSVKGDRLNDMRMVLENLRADGGTALYDAIVQAYAEVKKIKQLETSERIELVIVLTDGKDTASLTKLEALLNRISAEEGRLPTTIVIGYGQVDEKTLNLIAEKTGGKYYTGDPKTIVKVFEEIKTFF